MGPWVGFLTVWVAWDGHGVAEAQDHCGHVQDLNSAIIYQITNCSEFRMEGEAVLTATVLEHEGIFYAKVRWGACLWKGGAESLSKIKPPSCPRWRLQTP